MAATEEKTTPKQFDIQFYLSKFGIPLLEKKWIVLFFFLGGVLVALLLASFVKPQYISEAALQVEEPSTEMASAREERISRRTARASYVTAIEEKLKSKSFATEVLKILPEEAKEDLQYPLQLKAQLKAGIINWVKGTLGEKWKDRVKNLLGRESGPLTDTEKEESLISELEKRVGIRVNPRIAMIWITGATLDRNLAPILVKSYLDVLMATDLEENKKSIRAKIEFLRTQRERALLAVSRAEEELNAFRKAYEIPADLKAIQDSELQVKLDTLRSSLEMAKEQFSRLGKAYVESGMNEAGVTKNIKVLSNPMIPLSPATSAKMKIILVGVMMGLAVGVALVLIVEQVKGTIRYETDITDRVHLPILGNIPRL